MGYTVMIGLPGPTWHRSSMFSAIQASLGANTPMYEPEGGSTWDNFDILWSTALCRAKRGECTHYAQIHSDIYAEPGWLDIAIEEMDKAKVSFLSGIPAIKDSRMLTSFGISHHHAWQGAYRRMTVYEKSRGEWRVPGRGMVMFGDTFTNADLGYPDRALLHNNGCFVADLRDERFYELDDEGCLKLFWKFPKRLKKIDDGYQIQGESEDWWFSRQMYAQGIPSAATRRIKIVHLGGKQYPNHTLSELAPWKEDEEGKVFWGQAKPERLRYHAESD